ncbi:hypothetical protein RHMOL_Rhmol09G0111100 [Rhododendron molle]|uniref:Uncharacterized protein n=1 Tax=Rhododendron molle TaxID=49168 RepID=A0ACC0MC41_RHOML|nr:hypothetical protein RHMOL_Rhmol09G0111100 [Rhododendron molle]
MGHSDGEGIIVPSPLFNRGNLLKDLLQVQKHEVRFFMVNGRLETLQLVQRFGTAEAHRQVPQQKACFHALCICLLHYYLLGPSSGHADSMLLDFAQQIGNHVGFAGLALAETLIGLDVVKGDPTAQFSGSPLLLQFGTEQTAILGDLEYVVSKVHDASFRRNMLHFWPNRVLQEVAENFADKLSSSYKY